MTARLCPSPVRNKAKLLQIVVLCFELRLLFSQYPNRCTSRGGPVNTGRLGKVGKFHMAAAYFGRSGYESFAPSWKGFGTLMGPSVGALFKRGDSHRNNHGLLPSWRIWGSVMLAPIHQTNGAQPFHREYLKDCTRIYAMTSFKVDMKHLSITLRDERKLCPPTALMAHL
jgi:hypothetical protein